MVTLKEIAKAVGVSTATVSRVLNFDQTLSVTARKRQAIIETAEAMNYATPRARNRANQQGLSKVALVHFLRPEQEFIDPYYVGLRLGIESRCHALKIETVKVYHTDLMPEASLLQSASGVIAIGSHDDTEIAWLRRHSRNLVFADFAPDSDEFDCVHSDLSVATRKLLNALRTAGYKRIGFAGWTEEGSSDPFSEVRCRTYIEWSRQHAEFDPRICVTDRAIERNMAALLMKDTHAGVADARVGLGRLHADGGADGQRRDDEGEPPEDGLLAVVGAPAAHAGGEGLRIRLHDWHPRPAAPKLR